MNLISCKHCAVVLDKNNLVFPVVYDEDWKPLKIDARGLLAFIFQHEIDHLNGVTIA